MPTISRFPFVSIGPFPALGMRCFSMTYEFNRAFLRKDNGNTPPDVLGHFAGNCVSSGDILPGTQAGHIPFKG